MSNCKIVAEIGINHNGSIENAKKMIDVAFEAGCDYVKFQKRTIDKVYTQEQLDTPRESPWGTTTREQKVGLELARDGYDIIHAHCPVLWYASPWDAESVVFVDSYAPPFIKIPSALNTHWDLLEAVKESGKPVIMSTGMSTAAEVDAVVKFFGDQLEYILACTSTYPTKADEMNLRYIETLKKQYPDKRIGFSNHSPGIIFCLAAAAIGAEMIEFHLTLDRSMYGSDQAASIEPTGARRLVRDVRAIESGMGDGKARVWPSEEKIKQKLRG
jgi:N-acetylneuraminate synthase